MSPDTVHRITQDIKHWRSDLTSEELWLLTFAKSSARNEAFRRLNFWRRIIRMSEEELKREEITRHTELSVEERAFTK